MKLDAGEKLICLFYLLVNVALFLFTDICVPITLGSTSWHIHGKKWKQWQILFSWAPKSLQMLTAATKLKKTLAPWKTSYDKARQCFKKQRHHFADKGPYSESYGFSSSHVQMWELGHKEGWVPKNWFFLIVVDGEDSWESLGQQGYQTSQS